MASGALRSNRERSWTFHERDLESGDVQSLLALHFAQMWEASPPEACHVLAIDGLRDPAVTFWSAREDDELLGIGALKELAPDHGEVKSMRSTPSALGRGVGRAVLHHIVAEAKSRGYSRLSLETGSTQSFAAALRLYESEAFVPCGPFGDYQDTPFTRFFTLALSPLRERERAAQRRKGEGVCRPIPHPAQQR